MLLPSLARLSLDTSVGNKRRWKDIEGPDQQPDQKHDKPETPIPAPSVERIDVPYEKLKSQDFESGLALFSSNSTGIRMMRATSNNLHTNGNPIQLLNDAKALSAFLKDKRCLRSSNCYTKSNELLRNHDHLQKALRRVVAAMTSKEEATQHTWFGLRFLNPVAFPASGKEELIYSLQAANKGFGAEVLAAFPRNDSTEGWVYVFRPNFVDLKTYFGLHSQLNSGYIDNMVWSTIMIQMYHASKAKILMGDIRPSNIIVNINDGTQVFFIDFDPKYTCSFNDNDADVDDTPIYEKCLQMLHMLLLVNTTMTIDIETASEGDNSMEKNVIAHIVRLMSQSWKEYEFSKVNLDFPDWFIAVRDAFDPNEEELSDIIPSIKKLVLDAKQYHTQQLWSRETLHLLFWERIMRYIDYDEDEPLEEQRPGTQTILGKLFDTNVFNSDNTILGRYLLVLEGKKRF
jgi:hypothetical protein